MKGEGTHMIGYCPTCRSACLRITDLGRDVLLYLLDHAGDDRRKTDAQRASATIGIVEGTRRSQNNVRLWLERFQAAGLVNEVGRTSKNAPYYALSLQGIRFARMLREPVELHGAGAIGVGCSEGGR